MLRKKDIPFANADYRGHGGPDRWDERLRRVMLTNEDFNKAALEGFERELVAV